MTMPMHVHNLRVSVELKHELDEASCDLGVAAWDQDELPVFLVPRDRPHKSRPSGGRARKTGGVK